MVVAVVVVVVIVVVAVVIVVNINIIIVTSVLNSPNASQWKQQCLTKPIYVVISFEYWLVV